ncbi:MAG: hypothetical protein ACOYMA_14145 [Bacteroidia bacterium]
MKTKIIKTILPVIFGIFSVLALLVLYNLIGQGINVLIAPDKGFFKYFVPFVIIIAFFIQLTFTLPFWNKFKNQRKVWGLSIIQFTILLCLISGLTFGYLFWEPSLGITELLLVSLDGVIAFTVYWTVNLFTLKQLDK